MKRTIILLMALLLLISCAVAPPKKEEAMVVFYPPPPQQPRLQFLRSITGEDDLGKTKSKLDEFILGKSESFKELGKTYDIGSSQGKIYVLDRTVKKIIIIDLIKKELDYIRDQGLGALDDPSGIWITEDDIKYVADMKRKQVVVFGPDNKFLKAYGSKDLLDKPTDVAVYEDSVYVSDMNKHRIFVLDKETGNLKMTIGETGLKEGTFYKPTHVIVDHTGNIYVNDAFNFRIEKFDPRGKFLESFGSLGDALGSFARPKGLDIDKEGHLYVADAAFENVQIFDDKTTHLLLFFGGAGATPGSMYLPSGVHIDYDNVKYFEKYADKDFKLKYLLYVGNMFGNRKLNVYGYGDWVGQELSGDQIKADDKAKEKKKE
ncbi:MAG: 6-bladed beta-propeller [Proteobacteria bacterium]|nr:6-bladed beta-propeller [Pseudomonadota bacterium]